MAAPDARPVLVAVEVHEPVDERLHQRRGRVPVDRRAEDHRVAVDDPGEDVVHVVLLGAVLVLPAHVTPVALVDGEPLQRDDLHNPAAVPDSARHLLHQGIRIAALSGAAHYSEYLLHPTSPLKLISILSSINSRPNVNSSS